MKLLRASLVNRLGAAHGVDPRIGIKLDDVDKFMVKPKGHTFRKEQTILYSTEKKKPFGLANVEKKAGVVHGDFADAFAVARKSHPGAAVSIHTLSVDWIEEDLLERTEILRGIC